MTIQGFTNSSKPPQPQEPSLPLPLYTTRGSSNRLLESPGRYWFRYYCYGLLTTLGLILIISVTVLLNWGSFGLGAEGQLETGDDGPHSPRNGGEGWRALLGDPQLPHAQPQVNDLTLTQTQARHPVTLYYEVLCPFSRTYFVDQFVPTVLRLQKYILPILVPYGKANTTLNPGSGDLSFQCQHGDSECTGNIIHACGIKYGGSQGPLLRFLRCTMNSKVVNETQEEIGSQCAQEHGMDWDKISTCAKGQEGKVLLFKMGQVTGSLSPALIHVPTITVDGSQEGEDKLRADLLGYLCTKTLKDENPPECL